jgi:hypothetical protein
VNALTVLLVEILGTRGVGRSHPISTRTLAVKLGVPKRAVGELVAGAIEEGALIGSSCDARRPGYFLIRELDDLEEGTRHVRRRAIGCFRRIHLLREAAFQQFAEGEVQQLFDLKETA